MKPTLAIQLSLLTAIVAWGSTVSSIEPNQPPDRWVLYQAPAGVEPSTYLYVPDVGLFAGTMTQVVWPEPTAVSLPGRPMDAPCHQPEIPTEVADLYQCTFEWITFPYYSLDRFRNDWLDPNGIHHDFNRDSIVNFKDYAKWAHGSHGFWRIIEDPNICVPSGIYRYTSRPPDPVRNLPRPIDPTDWTSVQYDRFRYKPITGDPNTAPCPEGFEKTSVDSEGFVRCRRIPK